MLDILHKVGITSSVDRVYASLATVEGLRGWWTHDVKGKSQVGEVLNFHFTLKDAEGAIDMKVLEQTPGQRVLWEVVGGPPEWIGSRVSFDLRQEGDWAIVMFRHAGWKEAVDFMYHCSTKWGTFLLSLKALVETGKGSPNPHDFKLDSWE